VGRANEKKNLKKSAQVNELHEKAMKMAQACCADAR